jgi:large subunit ribosomal protein L28
MSRRCQLTGTGPTFGKSVSHSHRRTSRRFNANIQDKRFWLPSERRYVRLRLSTRAIKTVDRRGIESVVAELRRKGVKV